VLRGALTITMLVILAEPPAAFAATHAFTNEELFPLGRQHFRLCWQLEHDYYDLRERIAHAGVVWRRQQLELQWEDVRDRRREACSFGW
jgi:hypothetical protein